MRLRKLKIKNFRAYKDEFEINFSSMTALIGRNDVGKTSILDALGIFFGNKLCKFDSNDKCVYAEENDDVIITCVFDDLPEKIVIDTTSITSLENEYLLDEDGFLSLSMVFKKGKGAGSYYANYNFPSRPDLKDLLLKKNSDLKTIAKNLSIEAEDQRSNVNLRRNIFKSLENLDLKKSEIPLTKEDGKKILEQLKNHLPHFALFRADRPSTDEEAEVQDPMKIAVAQALEKVSLQLEEVKSNVKEKALEVAQNTLLHLKDLDSDLAHSLTANFKVEPKWDGIFKLTLSGDDNISINKRGSGVRRLVLISFFKAEAERIKKENNERGIIYGIEEPETSQHPDKQRILVEAFSEMSESEKCQIIVTTHVPALAEQIPKESIRHIFKDPNGDIAISTKTEDMYRVIAKDLGILPDSRAKVMVCVEGPNDISFLRNLSSALNNEGIGVPDFENDPEIVIIPLGGETLRDWVNNYYLRKINIPEVHIYDSDNQTPPKYQNACDKVNAREDGSIGFITSKREMENYLHPDAIKEGLKMDDISFTDSCDVPKLISDKLKIKEKNAKKRLNKLAAEKMNKSLLDEIDPQGDVMAWFRAIKDLCKR